MKKLLTVFLIIVLALSLCACDTTAIIQGFENLSEIELPELPEIPEESAAPEQEVQDSQQPEAEEPAAAPAAMPGKVIVSLKKTTLLNYAPDSSEQLILTFAYDTPIVSIEGNESASHAINDFTAYLEEEHYTGMQGDVFSGFGYYGMLEQAEDNYRYVHDSGAELPIEFSSSRAVDVLRADSSVLSLVYNDYIYTGGESGISVDKAFVFNTENGQRMSFDQLSDDSEALRTFVSEFVAGEIANDPELSTLAVEIPFSELLREESWYLSGQGLVILSAYTEFGSDKQGSLSFVIPYSELSGLIDTKWMPQIIDSPCSFILTEIPAEGTEIYDMVNVHEEGQVFYLCIEGIANQLKIASVEYADTFYETAEHWYGSYVSDCAIQICASIPEGMPELMISYLGTDGETHSMLVSQSGADGALILTDDSIEAVG